MASEEVNNIDVIKRNYCYRKNWKTDTPLYGSLRIVYAISKTEFVVLCKACWEGEIKQLHNCREDCHATMTSDFSHVLWRAE